MMVIVPKTIHPTPTYIPLQPKSEILFVGYPPILSPVMITHAQSSDFVIIPIDEGMNDVPPKMVTTRSLLITNCSHR